MPHSQSPRRPSSADLSGGLGMTRVDKSTSCASVPFHAQTQSLSTSTRPLAETPSMATAVQHIAPFSSQGASASTTNVDQPQVMQWPALNNFNYHQFDQTRNGHHAHNPFESAPEEYHQYSQNGISYDENYNLSYSTHLPNSSRPRSYNGMEMTGLANDNGTSQAYPPEAYQIDPPKQLDNMDLSDQESNGHLIQMSNDYDHHQFKSYIKLEDHTGYQSPYSTITRAPTPHDSLSPYPHLGDLGSEVAIDKEQPYAQLIYQALLHADGHTMILRDIYDWFKKHTDKASGSETKGWQNSIRHNLSMNGAFEKVDQPGEESRKGFMWRLSADAIREGVKSTTRYRSKAPNKRSNRNHFPQPQRQASGSKGGNAARRSVRMRRSNRMHNEGAAYRSDPYTSRSVPAAFDGIYEQGLGDRGGSGSRSGRLNSPGSGYASHEDLEFYGIESPTGFSAGSPAHLDLFGQCHGHDLARPYVSASGSLMPPHHEVQHHGMQAMPHGLPSSALGLADQPSFLFDHSPTDSLFADSPSPASMDEPCTPQSADGGLGDVWTEDVGMAGWEEGVYREYAG